MWMRMNGIKDHGQHRNHILNIHHNIKATTDITVIKDIVDITDITVGHRGDQYYYKGHRGHHSHRGYQRHHRDHGHYNIKASMNIAANKIIK